jgi:hypothetical protein
MAIDRIEITGPHNGVMPRETPSRQRIFVCTPSATVTDRACARTIISTLTRRAFRRPVSAEDVEPLMALYREGQARAVWSPGSRRP